MTRTRALLLLMALAIFAAAGGTLVARGSLLPDQQVQTITASPTHGPYSNLRDDYLFSKYDEVDAAQLGWPLLRSNSSKFAGSLRGRIENFHTDHPFVTLSYGSGQASITMIERALPHDGTDNCWLHLDSLEQMGNLYVQWRTTGDRTTACFRTGETSGLGQDVVASAVGLNQAELRSLISSLTRH